MTFDTVVVRENLHEMSGQSLRAPDWIIISTICGGSVILFFLSTLAQSLLAPPPGDDMFWLVSLTLNLLGYATVFLPGYYVIKYVRAINYLDVGPPSFLQPLVRLCVRGSENDNIDEEVLVFSFTEACLGHGFIYSQCAQRCRRRVL